MCCVNSLGIHLKSNTTSSCDALTLLASCDQKMERQLRTGGRKECVTTPKERGNAFYLMVPNRSQNVPKKNGLPKELLHKPQTGAEINSLHVTNNAMFSCTIGLGASGEDEGSPSSS